MELSEYTKDSVICSDGAPISQILVITKGSVKATFNGYTFLYEQGDILGICDLNIGIFSCTYTAVSDVTLAAYPYKNLSALDTLFRQESGVAYLMVCSMGRQILNLLQYKISLKNESDRAYELATTLYPQYEELCRQYAFAAKKLAGVSEVAYFSEPDPIDEWVYVYYMEIKNADQSTHKEFFHNKPGITSGFIRKAAEDAFRTFNVCKDYIKYLEGLSPVFLNSEGHDLFALITELHINSIGIKGADTVFEKNMAGFKKLLDCMTGIDQAYYQTRLNTYNEELAAKRASKAETVAPASAGIKQNLVDSLRVILDYSGCPDETCIQFTRSVQEYVNISGENRSDDAARSLRKQLADIFYVIYQQVLIRSFNDPALPTIIKMFLNFGYVDATLAGVENADFLYSIADSFKGNPDMGVYTLREWMAAIYSGQKEPSRNEFDMDYEQHIHQMKKEGAIDAKEEIRLMNDLEAKLRYEFENAFPVVNRVTSGSVSSFCPLFADQTIMRSLDNTLLTPEQIRNAFDEIRSIDFSAYYRETSYSDPQLGIPSDVIHMEVLPEIILLPNVGTRGMMWQEITGRKRVSPSRMFIPTFLQGDLKTLAIQLTGEFRWEMCKRIQGSLWGDYTIPSLTSEYVDYLQFYAKNRDLSADAKGSVKSELTRARSSYRKVFVANYTDWMLYEANGSSRLNKVARLILFKYCPFSAEIREELIRTIPRFAELSKRFTVNKNRRVKRLTNLVQHITQAGKAVPQEIIDELEYAQR